MDTNCILIAEFESLVGLASDCSYDLKDTKSKRLGSSLVNRSLLSLETATSPTTIVDCISSSITVSRSLKR